MYESIHTMPVWNWMEIHEKHDLTYLLVDTRHTARKEDLEKRWDALYSEYIAEFGIHDKYRDYLMKMVHIARMKCDMILTDDFSLQNIIEVEEFELENMIKDREKIKYMDIVASLSKFMGFHVNTRQITVFEYYSYLRSFERATKNNP